MSPLAERLRLGVDFALPVGRLAVGDQQKVEILKQLLAGRARADPRRAEQGARAAGGGAPVSRSCWSWPTTVTDWS